MNLRKLGWILACLVMLMGIGTAVYAAGEDQGAQPLGKMQTILKSNHFGKDWGFALGVKAWANDWSLPLELKSSSGTTNIVQFDSDMEVAFIPTGLVRYKNFFMGGSYMPGTDYDFNEQTLVNGHIISQVNGERKEWDLNMGYFLTPNLAATLGYKKIERELTLNDNVEGNVSYPLSADAPIIGLAASLPINEKFSFYGNFAYGWLSGDSQFIVKQNPTPNNMDIDGNYYLAELGFNYVIPIKKVVSGIAINLGYRFQRLDMEMTNDGAGAWNGSAGNQNDTTSGITFGVSASF